MNLSKVSGDVRGRYFQAPPRRARPSWKVRLFRHLPLVLFVALPTLLAAVYYFGIAADQYVSESYFVVRNAGGKRPRLSVGSFTEGPNVTSLSDETYAVQEFMGSRDALRALSGKVDIRAIFARPEADILSRFPPDLPVLRDHTTFEHLFKHYGRQVQAGLDDSTGLVRLWVKAYRAEDAALVARTLLTASETLVDGINNRLRENVVRDAQRNVDRARQDGQDIAERLAEFRNRVALLDPAGQSVLMLRNLTELQVRQLQLKLQSAELTKTAPQSPLLQVNERRIALLQEQIDAARGKITGSDTSMVPRLTEFNELLLHKELADKRLQFATTALDAARSRTQQQQVYLDTITVPNVSDRASHPRAALSVAVCFAVCLGCYAVGAMVIGAIREHMALFRLRAAA